MFLYTPRVSLLIKREKLYRHYVIIIIVYGVYMEIHVHSTLAHIVKKEK